jgi:hypothetical protein
MAATAELIVEATVESVREGRTVGDDSETATRFDEVTLSVTRTLYGTPPDPGPVLEEGREPELYPSSAVGDHGFYFLVQKADNTRFMRLINSEGRFLTNDGVVIASNGLDTWARDLERLTPEELAQRIKEAIDRAKRGEFKPASPRFRAHPGDSSE